MPLITGSYGSSGVILDVYIGVSGPRATAMNRHGLGIPSAIRLPFLVDTGADTTMVNEDTMRSLAIPQRGARDIVGATTHIDPTTCHSYDVQIEFRTSGEAPLVIPAIEVLARPFFNVSIAGLIGRDILDPLHFCMGRGRFRLEY